MGQQMTTLVSIVLWLVVVVVYATRQAIQATGLMPVDPYFLVLFALPIFLLIFGKITFSQMGFKIGKPATGLFLVFLLPGILFIRYFLTGLTFQIPQNYFSTTLVGSVGEEFFFRGYLQSQFEKYLGVYLSFFLTNFLFAAVHFVKGYDLASTAMTGMIGLYFSFTKDRRGGDSLVYSAGAHSLYNLVVSSTVRMIP